MLNLLYMPNFILPAPRSSFAWTRSRGQLFFPAPFFRLQSEWLDVALYGFTLLYGYIV